MERIVLDTNCLVSSLRRSSIYYPIWRDFVAGKYCLCFTDDILNEYQEIIEQRTGSVDIFLKRLTPAQAKPYTMKNTAVVCQAAGGAKPCLFLICLFKEKV